MKPLFERRPGGFDIRPASMPAAREIAPNIHLSEGLSNAWLVTTGAGRVIVNTGMGFEAPVHKRNFDAVSAAPVRYVLLTQGHVDHVGGIDVFREPGTEIVAQAGIVAQQAEDVRLRAFRARRSGFAFAETVAKGIEAVVREHGRAPPQAIAEPTITFEDSYAFDLGGVRFELYATPGGETTDSMVVWLPGEGACICGNLFGALFGHFPNLVTIRGDRYRDALRFVDSLDRVLALKPRMLLVGHHDPVVGEDVIRSELERLRGAVGYVHDETVRGMNEGKDVSELMREIRLPPDVAVGEGYGKVAWGVRAIYETYAGWFHHRSTTELYPSTPLDVARDFVAASGGIAPLVDRARARLAAGEPVAALHLLDVVLAVDANDRNALAASVECHRLLESESENFWLTSWLRHRRFELEARRSNRGGVVRITDLAVPVLDAAQRAALEAAERHPVDFDSQAILDEASGETGLSDFGPDDFRSRLELLADEWGSDTGLTALARIGLRAGLVRYASNRLLIRAALAGDPSIRDERIEAPVIIAGLPRTGTTHLLNLLAADRRFRALPLWEAYEPLPRPGEKATDDERDPRYARAAAAWAAMRQITPLLEAMHPMDPGHVHEELELMTPDFASYNFEWLSMSPRWRDHYLAADQTSHYAYMKDVLRILQRRRGPKRWVLKCPQHLEQLTVLDRTFPDATVIFTHRDPVAVLQSILTMLAYGQRVNRKKVEIAALVEYWTARIEGMLRACVRDRATIPTDRSLDVRFSNFTAREMNSVESIYRKAGIALGVETRLALERYLYDHRRGGAGRVAYDLEGDFGIAPASIRERFGFYYDRFDVPVEG